MSPREELHRLVDHIPEVDIPTTQRLLRALVDPVELALMNAPVDDEPDTEEDRSSAEQARREPGPGTTHAEVLREFGL